jgi:hypothetical protein
MVGKRIGGSGSRGIESVARELGQSIKCCEVAMSSASARTWHGKIQYAQKAHDVALRFVHRYRPYGHEANRINQRILHLRTLLEELNSLPASTAVVKHRGYVKKPIRGASR